MRFGCTHHHHVSHHHANQIGSVLEIVMRKLEALTE